MWKILLKTVPVNLKRDIGTYILMGILVATGMFIASAFSGITYSYVVGCEANAIASNSEDGQFQLVSPLSDAEARAIAQKGYALERAFYFDVDLEDGSTLRVMRTRQSIDRIVLDDGALPRTDSEAVLEKCYAIHHDLRVSDTVRLAARRICRGQCNTGSVTGLSLADRGGARRRRREQQCGDEQNDQHKLNGQHFQVPPLSLSRFFLLTVQS